MATLPQIEANRLNAQKSTGPRTPQGKAVSSQNALKSGLDAESQFVVGEDRAAFAALQDEYRARFQPLAPEERFQIDTLLRSEWILRRLFRAEAQLWEYHAMRADRSEGVPLGEALVAGNEVFRRLQRRITLAERSYKEAFAELDRLQRARRSLAGRQAASEPDRQTPPEQPPAGDRTEIGFVPPSSRGVPATGPTPIGQARVATDPPRLHPSALNLKFCRKRFRARHLPRHPRHRSVDRPTPHRRPYVALATATSVPDLSQQWQGMAPPHPQIPSSLKTSCAARKLSTPAGTPQ